MASEPGHPPSVVICHLGNVVALSATEAKIACERKPPWLPARRAQVRLALSRATLLIDAQARSVRRGGDRRYILDLEFHEEGTVARRLLETVGTAVGEEHHGPAIPASVVLPDLYGVLGVASGVEDAELRTAYRRLTGGAQTAGPRPDGTPNPAFARLREAFEILSDPELRRGYDEGVAAAAAA